MCEVNVAVMVVVVVVLAVWTSLPPTESPLKRLEQQQLQGQRLDVFVLDSGINGGRIVCYLYDITARTG